jgi:hypothetical protein
MISSVRDARYVLGSLLVDFLEKMQRGEAVDIEEKIYEKGTPLGILCALFISCLDNGIDSNSDRLLVFDYLVSKGASLNGTTPSGKTLLELATMSSSNCFVQLTEHVLKYKNEIDPETIKRAYQAAKASDCQEIVKLFNDVGINDQNINQ